MTRISLGSTHASSRRYAVGVVAVALLGVAMLVVYVLWSSAAISEAIQTSHADRARDAAGFYREKLARALGARDAASPEVWARLDPMLEEAFVGLPYLRGIVIRLPGQAIGAVIGPHDLGNEPFMDAPLDAAAMDVRVAPERTESGRCTVSFLVTPERTGDARVIANVHLKFTSASDLRAALFRQFQIGTILVVVVIYVLAFLAWLIGRQGRRAENREREKAVRLHAIGDVAGAIAHDLRNPLNAINLSFQVLGAALQRGGGAGESGGRDIARARGEIDKISKTVDHFVSFARLSDLNVTEFDFATVVRDALAALSPAFAEAAVAPALKTSGATILRGDRDKLAEAVTTLLQAALAAVKAGPGHVDVAVAGAGREVELRISGAGDQVDARRISAFTAARRTWDEPLGLGLTIARTWIDLHGGVVAGEEAGPHRVSVHVTLPRGAR